MTFSTSPNAVIRMTGVCAGALERRQHLHPIGAIAKPHVAYHHIDRAAWPASGGGPLGQGDGAVAAVAQRHLITGALQDPPTSPPERLLVFK